MRTFLKNLSRFRAATLLNLFGLTVAYAAALVVVLQVWVERTTDTQYPDSDRLYRLERAYNVGSIDSKWDLYLSRPQIELLGELGGEIEAVAFRGFSSDTWIASYLKVAGTPGAEHAFRMATVLIDPNLVPMLGMRIVEGEPLGDDPTHVLIPQSLARERFEGSPIGQTLELVAGFARSKRPMVVGGVYEDFPSNSTLSSCVYVHVGDTDQGKWDYCNYTAYVRLKPGADLTATALRIAKALNDGAHAVGRGGTDAFRLQPLRAAYFATDTNVPNGERRGNRTKVDLFALVALLIVLIGAINYANFATALVPMRVRGLNTRKVYGASDVSLRRGLVAEAAALSVGAYVIAAAGVAALGSLDAVSFVATKVVPTDHWGLIGLGALVAAVVGVVSGLFPAYYATSMPAAVALKGSAALSPRGKVLRTALVGFQFVVSIVLIAAATYMNRQYAYTQDKDMGFRRSHVLTVQGSSALGTNFGAWIGSLRSLSEVSEATFSDGNIVEQHNGYGRNFKDQMISYSNMRVAANFLDFFGLSVVEGEGFQPTADEREFETTMLFNRTAQRMYNVQVGDSIGAARVAGIIEDFHTTSLHQPIEPFALYNYGQPNEWSGRFMQVQLRVSTADLQGLVKQIEKKTKEVDPNWVGSIRTMDGVVEELYADDNRARTMISWFSGAAILVSLFGVFGLVHFDVAARRKEIGLRKVNGATEGQVLSIFTRRFLWILIGATVVAVPVAWWAVGKLLEPFAYRIPLDVWGFAAAAAAVYAVTLATVVAQAWSAARENPINYLGNE